MNPSSHSKKPTPGFQVCLLVCLLLFVCLSVGLWFVCLLVCSLVYRFVCLFVCLFVPSMHPNLSAGGRTTGSVKFLTLTLIADGNHIQVCVFGVVVVEGKLP